MKIYLLLFFCFTASLCRLTAQEKNTVEEVKDPMIALLQRYRAQSTEEQVMLPDSVLAIKEGEVGLKTVKGTVAGYRIQIYSGYNRQEAQAIQSRFKRMYSDIGAYLTYGQPNFRVKVGDFTSRKEADALVRELKKYFNSVFIFNEPVSISY